MRRLARIALAIGRSAVYLVALVLILAGALLAVLQTGWGKDRLRSLIVGQANRYLAATLEIGRLEGSLFRDLTLANVRLSRDGRTMAAIAYLAVVGSVISFLAYFSLLKTWSTTSLSFISVFTPAIALLLGFAFLDERPTPLTAVGGALILAGVTLALTKGR